MAPRARRLPPWRRLAWRIAGSLILLTALAIGLSGYLQYRAQDAWLRRWLGVLLVNVARTGALGIDPARHAEAVATRRQDTEAYRTLRATLAAVQDVNRLPTPIYTLVGFDAARRQAEFAVTSRGPGLPGEPYPLVPALLEPLRRAFEGGEATYTDVYRNQSGTWITAFAPLRDGAGRVVAVLDVDYPVEVYLAELAAVRRRVVLHALVGAAVALGAGVWLARRITRPVAALADAGRRVVEGELGARARIGSRDEVGLLGHVLNLMVERVEVSHRSLVDVLVRALEAREAGPGALRRLAAAAGLLGERLGLGPAQREALQLGALLHDIGEIRVPEAVLAKAGPLEPGEWATVRAHPQAGVELLETVPLLTPALDVVGAHHERYDGGGYPLGLRGDAIPLTARVFAVADALDAMTRPRPHRAARSVDEALAVLKAEAGGQFDRRVVEAALAVPPAEWTAVLGLPAPPASA